MLILVEYYMLSALIKKDNQIFLIYKEIQNGAVAKLSFMRKGFLLYEEMSKYLIIYEKAVIHMTLQLLHSEFPNRWGLRYSFMKSTQLWERKDGQRNFQYKTVNCGLGTCNSRLYRQYKFLDKECQRIGKLCKINLWYI